MSQDLLQDWQTLYASAISQAESGQLGTGIEEAEVAIQRRLEANALSALEEAELYARSAESQASEEAASRINVRV